MQNSSIKTPIEVGLWVIDNASSNTLQVPYKEGNKFVEGAAYLVIILENQIMITFRMFEAAKITVVS